MRGWPLAVAVLVWLVAGFGVAWCALKWWGTDPFTPVPVTAPPPTLVDSAAVAQTLGAARQPDAAAAVTQPVPAAATRFQLVGVLAAASSGAAGPAGVALIATDGQAPRPYRVGAVVDGSWRVHAVQRRAVVLASADWPAGTPLPPNAGISLALPDIK